MAGISKAEVSFDQKTTRLLERIARALEGQTKPRASFTNICDKEHLTYDETTLTKVHTALAGTGLNDGQILDIVNELQNAGILFRERA